MSFYSMPYEHAIEESSNKRRHNQSKHLKTHSVISESSRESERYLTARAGPWVQLGPDPFLYPKHSRQNYENKSICCLRRNILLSRRLGLFLPIRRQEDE